MRILNCIPPRLVAVAALVISARAAAGDTLPVYTDSLAAGWQNWSWSTTVNFSNPSPVYGGVGASVSIRYDAAWVGLYLHNDSPISTSSFTTVRFQIHGGVAGGHALRLVGYDAANQEGQGVSLAPTVAGQWRLVEVPLSSFGISSVSGLVWQDTSGAPQPAYYLDAIEFVSASQPPASGPDLAVNILLNRHPINPLIYGMNFADPALAAELALPVNRWGGNATTRYNWQLDTSNHASDWYFENIPETNGNPGQLPNGSACDSFVDANRARGGDSIITLPLIGWTPKQRAVACGFSVARYGPQQSVDPYNTDCGNGVHTNGTPITGNDPLDTSIAIGPPFVQAWIAHLIGRYGAAAQGGVRFYAMDNETALWNDTHRDVHPSPVSYDELRDRTYQYAAAVKTADPSALTLGPVAWGWVEYFYSALDVAAGGDWWNTRPDRRAHGDVPLIEWYLDQMRSYEQQNGRRILDYMDLHYYPQAAGVTLGPAGNAATQALRLRSTRSLWDASYVDESWVADTVRLIPRMRDWASAHYPGTGLAITEYNWGGLEHINGALAQADVLGIFGRERLDLATLWDPPTPSEPGAFAFRVFRNYDAAGAKFGGLSVDAQSQDSNQVSVFAAERTDGVLTLILINKTNNDLTSNLTLTNFTALGNAKVFRYSAQDLTHIVRLADLPIPGGLVAVSMPAASITLLALPGPPPGDLNGDGAVTLLDLAAFVNVLLGLDTNALHLARSDTNADGVVNGYDIGPFIKGIH